MEEEAAFRCVCGYNILCEVRSGGEGIGFLVFFDDEPTSETCGKLFKRCPGCGKHLGLPMLLRKKRPG